MSSSTNKQTVYKELRTIDTRKANKVYTKYASTVKTSKLDDDTLTKATNNDSAAIKLVESVLRRRNGAKSAWYKHADAEIRVAEARALAEEGLARRMRERTSLMDALRDDQPPGPFLIRSQQDIEYENAAFEALGRSSCFYLWETKSFFMPKISYQEEAWVKVEPLPSCPDTLSQGYSVPVFSVSQDSSAPSLFYPDSRAFQWTTFSDSVTHPTVSTSKAFDEDFVSQWGPADPDIRIGSSVEDTEVDWEEACEQLKQWDPVDNEH